MEYIDVNRRIRALVVDDEPAVRTFLCRWLREDGHECEEAGDAEEALAILETKDFDVLLTDLRMPGRGGLELVETARAADPELAILVVSGVAGDRAPVEALQRGAWAWIGKPFEREEVRIQLLCALRRRELERRARREHERLEEEVQRRTAEIRRRELELAERLVTASEFRDDETGAHIRRIGLLASRLARHLGWSERDAEDLRVAATMHDLGKIGIPDRLLRKPGRFTPEERAEMERHSEIGAGILEGTDVPMLEMARQIALCHHERWDGEGYPRGLSGEEIPEAARIVSVVDVYDALTHERVYRPALSEAEAAQIVRTGRDRAFDPHVVDTFLAHRHELIRGVDESVDASVPGEAAILSEAEATIWACAG